MELNQQTSQNLKGTWNQAILTFLFPILLVLTVRWAIVEPFVIPSGSMIPNLLVHDHILVKKFSYGVHVPFGEPWIVQWSKPERGEVIVFRYPENPDVYYIKRLIGLPRDRVTISNGRISVNGKVFAQTETTGDDPAFKYFLENNGAKEYVVRYLDPQGGSPQTFEVPEGNFFFMGDNRDQSSDSRVWGFVKNDYIVGQASVIWLSCHSTLPTMSFVCDPSQIRFNRLFKKVQ